MMFVLNKSTIASIAFQARDFYTASTVYLQMNGFILNHIARFKICRSE